MAIRLDTSAKSLTRTTNLPSPTSWTMAGWVVRRGAGATINIIGALVASGASAYQYIGDNGTNVAVGSQTTSANIVASPGIGVPYFFALTCSGTGAGNLIGYYGLRDATALTTASVAGVTFTPATLTFSDSSFGANFNGDVGPIYLWDAVLTQTELEKQKNIIRLSRSTNINAYYPMMRTTTANNVLDFSGNGRNLTANGTPGVIDNPPISYGGESELISHVAAAGGRTTKNTDMSPLGIHTAISRRITQALN